MILCQIMIYRTFLNTNSSGASSYRVRARPTVELFINILKIDIMLRDLPLTFGELQRLRQILVVFDKRYYL